jgi:guanylate cyclase
MMIGDNPMKPTLTERLAENLYEPAGGPYEPAELKAIMTQVVATMLIGAPILLVWAFVYLYFSEKGAFIGFAGYATFDVVVLALLAIRRMRATWVRNLYLGVHLAANFLIVILLGGIVNSTGIILFALIAPFSMITQPTRQFLTWLGATIGLAILTVAQQPLLRTSNHVPFEVSTIFWGINLVNFSVILYWNLKALLQQRDTALELLQVEQRKSENLLLNILPSEIARVLKNETRTIADYIDQASVLFADVVNFTPMSATMTPTELVELLNEVYSHFDMLVEKYDLEKIKTIGDCYMVAAGVPRRRADHAIVITQLALDLRDYVSSHAFHGRQLQFRMGINSGSLVAGVIGTKKFAYDLWGDTVNTASRMESHGSGGFIQITEDTYDLIKNDFLCESRGKVDVKGKGEISVWVVTDKLS